MAFDALSMLVDADEQNATAQHRYSEFESLRLNLTKLYPTLIIPPIPSKQTIGDYAIKQAKAKEDAAMIARRKRMLQTFLNRIARHPILSNEHVFHRFLDGEVSWVSLPCSLFSSVSSSSCRHYRQKFYMLRLYRYFRRIFSRHLHIILQTKPVRPLMLLCPHPQPPILYDAQISASWTRRYSRISLPPI